MVAAVSTTLARKIEHPDTIVVNASTTELRERSFEMRCRMRSVSGDGAIVGSGSCSIELADPRTGEPVPVPRALREELIALEANARHFG